ncbi:replicative DNA helicase [uncultured Maricaulis sp.]|uniref:replicative DNA helicase n=1 Tax=uncultured Maricaulis sp. TaxID=174710 RepID=UPI0030D9B8DE|tara:strand:- start:34356 stop:35837 length:1482 start_codon:yes stop_codon:yes gene_type:complete
MTTELMTFDAGVPTTLETAPHNLEAEQAFLGALLYDNEIFHRIADWLKPEHFYDPVHGRIFETASDLIGRGSLADAVVLKTQFDRDDGLREIGGTTYLAVLIESAANNSAATEYARMIYELALRRDLIRIGDELSATATTDAETQPRKLIEAVEQQLFNLAEAGSTSRGFVSFKQALTESVETAAAAYERDGGLSGISSGLKALDEKLGGMHPSDLIILAGRPSMGKTALATNIAFDVARNYEFEEQPDGTTKTTKGGVVGFFSLEMSAEQLAMRLIADYTGIPGYMIRQGTIDATQYEEIRDAVLEIQSLPLYIDDTGGLPIGALAARARRLKRTHGLDLIIVDYLQLVTSSRNRPGDSRVQEVSEVTQNLKALAKELEVPVIALSQLSRNVESREDKKPQLSDLRESGSIEQDADVVLFVYREAYYKEREKPREDTPEYLAWQEEFRIIEKLAEVVIGKQRHGAIGTAKLAFDGARTKFSDLDERFEDGPG